jgi:hypothetical protein
MLYHFITAILGSSPSIAAVLIQRAVPPDNTAPTGSNPIVVSSVQFLGNLTADNSCSHRDLGFTGSIKGVWYNIWGDVIWCNSGVTDPNKDGKGSGIVHDAISQATTNPLKVHDLNLNKDAPVAHQNQFVPYNTAFGENAETGFGGTSLCETNATSGEAAFFYLVVSIYLKHYTKLFVNRHNFMAGSIF